MRLARTASPLPRYGRSGWLESNQRSPVPETGGAAFSPTARCGYPRRDSNPRFRAENPASLALDHGGKRDGSEALEPNEWCCLTPCSFSASRAATDTGLRRKLRRQGSNLRLAVNSRASYRSTTPERWAGRRRKERSRTLNGVNLTRFRDGIPHQWQSFQSGPGRSRTCTPPIKSRQLCRVELRSHECGRQESNLRRVAFQATALPH